MLILLTCESFAQKECKYNNSVPFPNTLSAIFEFTNYFPGLRYDYQVNDNLGLYGMGLYGKYYTEQGSTFTRKHIKTSAGVVFYIPNYSNSPSDVFFGAGLNYHYYQKASDRTAEIVPIISVDINAGIRLNRYVITILYDILKPERGASFGIRF